MLAPSSPDEYISKAVKRYSSLFTLPSLTAIAVLLGALCMHGGVLVILPLQPSYNGLILGMAFGAIFLSLTFASDIVISHIFVKEDLIFDLRRCLALSLFSCLIWFGIMFLGSLASVFLGTTSVWVKFFFLGFCGALILRLLVFSTTSFAGPMRNVFLVPLTTRLVHHSNLFYEVRS